MHDTHNQRLAQALEDSPVLLCPRCKHGSTKLFAAAQSGGKWHHLTCPRCDAEFDVVEAIDEMFVEGQDWAYVYFAGCNRIVRHVACVPGRTAIADIRGVFDRVYRVIPWHSGISGVLAGGISWKHIPQGYIMLALASPHEERKPRPIGFFLTIIGKPAGAPPLPMWRELLLQGRLAAFEQPALTVVLAVAAIDLFIEDVTEEEVGSGRPKSWRDLLATVDLSLDDLLGEPGMENLRTLNRVRNKLAHGKPYLDKLPADLAAAEIKWHQEGHRYEGEGAISPVAKFAMRTALSVLRACRKASASTSG